MRPRRIISLLVLALLLAAASAHARPLAVSKRFETDKKLGVGLMLGVPSGATGKLMLSSEWALDVGAGAYIAYRDRTGFHMHADLLWHPFVAVEGLSFMAPLYVGLGPRYLRYDGISHVGARLPVGLSFVFDELPIDIFMESAFVVDFSMGEGGEGAVDVNGLLGLRYFFL